MVHSNFSKDNTFYACDSTTWVDSLDSAITMVMFLHAIDIHTFCQAYHMIVQSQAYATTQHIYQFMLQGGFVTQDSQVSNNKKEVSSKERR